MDSENNSSFSGAFKLTRDVDRNKFYNGYGIGFDGTDLYSLQPLMDIKKAQLKYSENVSNNLLILGKWSIVCIKREVGEPKNFFRVNITKARTKFCWSLHYNGDKRFVHLNEIHIHKVKGADNIPPQTFYLRSVCNNFTVNELREIKLNGVVSEFLIDHSPITIKTTGDILEFFIKKHNINDVSVCNLIVIVVLSFGRPLVTWEVKFTFLDNA